MPELGFYMVTFMRRKDDHRQRLDVFLAVGDGEHPVVERAKEVMAEDGYHLPEWEVFYASELSSFPISTIMAMPFTIPYTRHSLT